MELVEIHEYIAKGFTRYMFNNNGFFSFLDISNSGGYLDGTFNKGSVFIDQQLDLISYYHQTKE